MAKGRKPVKLQDIVNANELEAINVEATQVESVELVETKEVVTPIKTSGGRTYVPQGLKVQIRQKATGRIIALAVEKTYAESLCKSNPNIEIV